MQIMHLFAFISSVLVCTAAFSAEVLDSAAVESKARHLFEAGKYGEALPEFNRLIKMQPTNANAYDLRGYRYSETGEQGLAIKDYSEAIRLDPTDKRALNNRRLRISLRMTSIGQLRIPTLSSSRTQRTRWPSAILLQRHPHGYGNRN